MNVQAGELDKRFDAGEDIIKYLDLAKARRPNQEQRRVSVRLPAWMIQALDREAKRLGIPRSALIRGVVAHQLECAMPTPSAPSTPSTPSTLSPSSTPQR